MRFGTKRFHGFGGRADKGKTTVNASAWESGVFREKTVTGMDGVAAGAVRHVNDFLNTKITFPRRRGADCVGFIGEADMKRLAVHVTENRDGADSQFATGAQDAHGNFTAVGN